MRPDINTNYTSPIILIAYSLDMAGKFLLSLQKETKGIKKVLQQRMQLNEYRIEVEAQDAAEDVWNSFARAKDAITIFHYAGHAIQKHLILERKNDAKLESRAFAKFLQLQPNLKLVFLNACLTEAHQSSLLEARIPYLD